MSEFTVKNWKDTLYKVYTKSIRDAVYRQLCVVDPIAAIKEVSDIELPPDLKVRFYADSETYEYTYLLPPAVNPNELTGDEVDRLVAWNVYCTADTNTH